MTDIVLVDGAWSRRRVLPRLFAAGHSAVLVTGAADRFGDAVGPLVHVDGVVPRRGSAGRR